MSGHYKRLSHKLSSPKKSSRKHYKRSSPKVKSPK